MLTRKRSWNVNRRALLVSAFTLSILSVGLASLPVRADQLNDLRATGAIGEAFDGFARARDGSAKDFVNNLNEKRRPIYEKRAKSQGVSVDQVGRVYAGQIFQKAPAGTWFLGENGNWTQK